ncbi:unnamed protein product [Ascophyllum nodosum]
MTTPNSSPTVPDVPERVHVAFSSEVAPIRDVTVFCENKAEITRNVNFSSPSKLGRHEVELTGLPNRRLVDGESVRVRGSGHCSILHVAFSDQPKEDTRPEPTEEEKQAKKAEKEKQEAELKRLSDEHTVLAREFSRNERMRKLVDRYADGVVTAKAREHTNAVPPPGTPDITVHSTHEVEEALSWWADKAAKTDAEAQRLETMRYDTYGNDMPLKINRLESTTRKLRDGPDAPTKKAEGREKTDKPGRVIISVDVHELGPIEMEVKYMVYGATWSPEYDLRVDTLTDSVSCTYFGRVTQTTTEDWEGVALRLSTAEPSVRGTPPSLRNKTVSFKVLKRAVSRRRQLLTESLSAPSGIQSARKSALRRRMASSEEIEDNSVMHRAAVTAAAAASAPSAPLLPPAAKPSVARVEGSKGALGVVSFAVSLPAIIKSNGQTKKLIVGEFQLSAEVNHYVVPSKEPAAYLQAKTTNDTEYELLPSNDVSIFFDNSFVTKTSLTSVSPGESFQAFLGIDPAVKITVAPPRKTSSKRGLFSKSNHVTHKHSTSIYNKKKVPVTCVVLEAMPLSTDESIKVTLNQPPPPSVSDSEAINDEVLVSAALEMFAVGDEGKYSDSSRSSKSTNLARSMKSGVAGVAKSPSNHLVWVGKIPPQSEIKIPLEYNVEWPIDKEIEVFG